MGLLLGPLEYQPPELVCVYVCDTPPTHTPLTFHPPDKDRDKAKDKYVRSLWKLFAHHNRYVLGVRAAQLHHQHYHQFMLPGLLQSLQDLHEEMAAIL